MIQLDMSADLSASSIRRLGPQQRRLLTAYEGVKPRHWPRVIALVDTVQPWAPEALHARARALVAQHAIWRTRFPVPKGLSVAVQACGQDASFRFEHIAPGDDLAGIADQAGSGPTAAPVWIGHQGRSVAVCLSGLCADARSLDLFVAGLAGAPPPVEAGLEFADVADWLAGFELDASEAERLWWRNRIEPSPSMPFSRARDVAGDDVGEIRFIVPPALQQRIEARSAELGIEPRAFWLAVWFAAMRGIADGPVCIEVEFDGRAYDGLSACMGPLARRAPLSWPLDPRTSFGGLAILVGADLHQAGLNQEVFDPCLLPRAGGIGFAWRETVRHVTGADRPTSMRRRRIVDSRCLVDCQLEWRRDDPQASLELILSADRNAIASNELGHLLDMVLGLAGEAAAADPGRAVRAVLRAGAPAPAAAAVPSPSARPESLLAEIARWVGQTPDAMALVDTRTTLSYRMLWREAGKLAQSLAASGAGPQRPAGLLAGRSADAVVAILAAWRCGAAYLPLDPSLPPAQLCRLCAAAPLAALMADADNAGLAQTIGLPVIRLDQAGEGDDPPAMPAPPPQSCAYLMATSGSTGAPKLVAVEHRNLAAYGVGYTARAALPPALRYAVATGWATDFSLTMLAGAFASGGSLHILPLGHLLEAEAFGGFMQSHAIDVLKLTPSHLAALLADSRSATILPARLLVLGGEQASWDLIGELARRAPRLRLLNHYGPTESTVGVIAGEIDPSDAGRIARPPLGTPLPGLEIHVLDDDLEPVADWVAGMIFVGGASVARGYEAAPARTAQAFIANPLGPGRLYATGDRAYRLPDGRIVFVGRADTQVKIRGHRVEPAETEIALARLPAVQRAVVVARAQKRPEGTAQEIRLAAYIVLREGAVWDPAGWRAALAAELPGHLLPATITRLQAVPLRENGKLDAARLPPEATAVTHGPLNRLEAEVARLWCAILDTASVGPDDRFFDIGGHSLSLIRLRQALRDTLDADVPLPELFNHPTVRSMAALVAGLRDGDALAAAASRAGRQRAALGTGRGNTAQGGS